MNIQKVVLYQCDSVFLIYLVRHHAAGTELNFYYFITVYTVEYELSGSHVNPFKWKIIEYPC